MFCNNCYGCKIPCGRNQKEIPVSQGKKFDTGKPDLSLIPLSALKEEAKGFMLGEQKYGRYNYTKGMEASRLVAAALRHIHAWMDGHDIDPESGASHLGHARCCLAMLLHTQELGTLIDNRFKETTHVPENSGIDSSNLLNYIK